jgi:hypothetical protein
MNPLRLHQDWITAIGNDPRVADSKAEGIINHIQLHAGPHLQAYVDDKKDMRLWAAGMLNLMCIFEEVVLGGDKITVDEMLDRLYHKSTHDPHTTPCPLERMELVG